VKRIAATTVALIVAGPTLRVAFGSDPANARSLAAPVTPVSAAAVEGEACHPASDFEMGEAANVAVARPPASFLIWDDDDYGELKAPLRSELGDAPHTAMRRRATATMPKLEQHPFHGRIRAQGGANVLNSPGSRFTILHWPTATLAYELGFGTARFGSGTDIVLGARFYPRLTGRIRPYAGAAVGRFEVFERENWEHGVAGGELKVGFDTLLGGRLSIHAVGRAAFAGGRWGFSPEVGLGWTFGGSRPIERP
jgi:hypothetical protein